MPTAERKAKAPHTRVKSRGKVSQRLEILANMYLETRPKEAVRWVFSPEHKPDLSNVVNRQIDGYRLTYVRDLGDKDTVAFLPGMKPSDLVRVGDVVMMAIDAAIQQEIREDLDGAAAEERTRVEQEFYHAVDEMQTDGPMREEYRAKARGRSHTEEVEVEVAGPDSHRED